MRKKASPEVNELVAPRSMARVLRKIARYTKQNESFILLISVGMSCFSSIIAAVALYYTASEVSILSEERLTPYKVTLFNQRLEGVRQTLEGIATFEHAAICYSRSEEIEVYGDYIKKDDLEQLKSCENNVGQALLDLDKSIKRNILFWPRKSRIRVADYLIGAYELQNCDFMAPFAKSENMPLNLRQSFDKNCATDHDGRWDKLVKLRNSLQADAGELIDVQLGQ